MSDEPLLTWKGRRVRAPGEGIDAATRKVPAAPRPGSLFFVPSPLEGWGLDVLLQRLSDDSVVILLEVDPELRRFCDGRFRSHLGPQREDPRLLWLETDSEAAVSSLFEKLPLDGLRRCEFLTLGGSWLAHSARYRQVFQRLDDGLTRWWANRMTFLHLGPLWVRNLFDNLKAREFSPRPWPTWDEKPIFVCGAGVTLESAVLFLKESRHRWHLLAVDTALPVLHEAGLVPDGVVCVESQHANLRDFSGWKGASVPLFADLTAHPSSTRVFSQLPYWFVSEFAPLALWRRWPWDSAFIPRLPPLGSVGVVAAWVAWRLTRGPVVLAGLDFSYPPGKTHARGAPALTSLLAGTDRLHPMEQVGTWDRPGLRSVRRGWLTTPVLESYAGLLAERAAAEAHRTWVWQNLGLPLGLPPWQGSFPPPSPPSNRPEEAEAPASVQAATWLRKERVLWSEILSDFQALNESSDPSVWARLQARLREADYLTFSFPDPHPRLATDWLVRVLTQVRWISERMGGTPAA